MGLTPDEWRYAARIGCQRQIHGILAGWTPANNVSLEEQAKEGWFRHINGACGELCLAKYMGIKWNPEVPVEKIWDGDVDNIEVRTRPEHTNDLSIKPGDQGNRFFVLVTGTGPSWKIHGYLLGRDAKVKAWLTRGVYYVPHENLYTDMEDFRERYWTWKRGQPDS